MLRLRLLFLLHAVLLLALSGRLRAQQACFTFLSDSVGCAPFTVTVRSCTEPTAGLSFNFVWRPNPPVTDYQILPAGETDMSYTYSQPGTYIIDQFRTFTQSLKRTVRVYSKEALPRFSVSTCRDTLRLQFTDTVFSSYAFLPGDGSPEITIDKSAGPFTYRYSFSGVSGVFPLAVRGIRPLTCNQATVRDTVTLYSQPALPLADTLTGLDSLRYRARFRVRADEPYGFTWLGPGGPAGLGVGVYPSDSPDAQQECLFPSSPNGTTLRLETRTGCGDTLPAPPWPILFPRARPDNQKIFLSWPRPQTGGSSDFELLRNGKVIRTWTDLTDTSLVDSADLICGELYCYRFRIRSRVPGYSGALVFISAPVCAAAVSSRPPDPVSAFTATIDSRGVVLNGKVPPQARSLEVFRSEDGSSDFSLLGNFAGFPLTDTLADVQSRTYCYRIGYNDICGNRSLPGQTVCPVFLRLSLPDESARIFTRTDFQGWTGGTGHYKLIRTGEGLAPEFIPWASPSHSLILPGRDPARQRMGYRVMVVAADRNLYPDTSFSNPVEVVQVSRLRFPDVFTPNEDNVNEVFRCYPLFIRSYELRIYNAWGNIIFASTDPKEGWDGRIAAQPAPSGPYAYFARGVDEAGKTLETRGFFNLIR